MWEKSTTGFIFVIFFYYEEKFITNLYSNRLIPVCTTHLWRAPTFSHFPASTRMDFQSPLSSIICGSLFGMFRNISIPNINQHCTKLLSYWTNCIIKSNIEITCSSNQTNLYHSIPFYQNTRPHNLYHWNKTLSLQTLFNHMS